MHEHEPYVEHDPFSDALKTYLRDVQALEADGELELDNNRDRLKFAFYDLLDALGVPTETSIEKMNTVLPTADLEGAGISELALQYKLAPIRLLDQRQPDCPFPIELLTVQRIEKVFNLILAGEEIQHANCIDGSEEGSLMCEHALTCPMRIGRYVGKNILELLVIQRQIQEDIEPQSDPTFFNLLQLHKSLVSNQLMLPGEIEVHTKLARDYADEQFAYMVSGHTRETDETNGD